MRRALLLLPLLALSACSSASAPPPAPATVTVTASAEPTRHEDAYLAALAGVAPRVDAQTKLALGNQACDLLEGGLTPDELGDRIGPKLVSAGMGDAARTFGSALLELCPGAVN